MNKKRRKWFFLSLFSVMICIVFLLYWYKGKIEKEETHFVLTYAEIQREDYPTTQGAKYFADQVYRESEGKIKIVIKPEGMLGTESEVLDQLRYGGIDLARVSLSQFSDLIPEYNILQLPYLYESAEHMWRVLDGEIGRDFLKLASRVGLVSLSWYDGGVRNFYTREKPITCLKDFEGMKIRVPESSIMEDTINALGAYAVRLPYDEVYSCLERGVVDGAENNWPSYVSMQHNEVTHYYTEDEHNRIPEVQLVSSHTWEKLSKEDQEIIRTSALESAEYERKLWKKQIETSKKKAIEQGIEVIEISEEEKQKMRDTVQVIYETYSYEQKDIIEKIRQMAEE